MRLQSHITHINNFMRKGGENMKTKTLAEEQKELEDILSDLGYEPTDEYEDIFGKVIFTKYEKFGIGVRIERNL